MNELERWHELGQQLRVDSIRAASVTNSGHPTSSMSAADLMAVLISKYLHYDFDDPKNPNNDHLIFSKGHASPLLYSIYKAAGRDHRRGTDDVPRASAAGWRAIPTPILPWVDVATGSLGQGLPIGVGVALAGKRLDRLPYSVWVLLGDSEMAEGSHLGRVRHAAYYELDNLVAIIDVNRLGQRGETMHGWDLCSYTDRARAFGWHAIQIDGHNLAEIDRAFEEAMATTGRPTVIVAHTMKGKGVARVENKDGWHGKALDDPEQRDRGARRVAEPDRRRAQAGAPASRTCSSRPASWSCRCTSSAATRRRARRTATRSRRSAPPAATWWRMDGEVCNSTHAEEFAKAYPERYFEMYIAEQQMVATAVGMQVRRVEAVRVDVRRVPVARLRLHPHGGDLPREHAPVRLARGRLDRRGRPVADGARGPGDDARGPRQHRPLPVRREPDGEAGRAAGRPGRASPTCAPPAEETPVIYGPDEEFPIGGSTVVRSSDDDQVTVVGAGHHPARGDRGGRPARGRRASPRA